MKILLINDSSNFIGGAEVMLQVLKDGLRQRGHDARLFTSLANSDREKCLADYYCFGTTSSFRTLLQTANPWAYWTLRKVLMEFRPDVVHVNIFLTQMSPWILPLLKDIPSLYHVVWYRPVCPLGTKMLPDGTMCRNSPGLACYQSRCLPLRDWLPLMLQMKWFNKWRHVFKAVVANSEFVKSCLISEGISPVEVIWNGTPIQTPRPPLSAPPTAAFAGHLSAKKGGAVLLKAFSKVIRSIPEARLFIAGQGPEENSLKRLVQTLGLFSHVSMVGFLSRQEVEKTFAQAWVQVVPSCWNEPFGIVAIEAMMRGTAVIASRSGGVTEIVRQAETGFLVEPGNEDELADALSLVLKDRELAERMGRAGRHVALDQFQEGIFLEKFINLYERLIESKKLNPARQTEEVFS